MRCSRCFGERKTSHREHKRHKKEGGEWTRRSGNCAASSGKRLTRFTVIYARAPGEGLRKRRGATPAQSRVARRATASPGESFRRGWHAARAFRGRPVCRTQDRGRVESRGAACPTTTSPNSSAICARRVWNMGYFVTSEPHVPDTQVRQPAGLPIPSCFLKHLLRSVLFVPSVAKDRGVEGPGGRFAPAARTWLIAVGSRSARSLPCRPPRSLSSAASPIRSTPTASSSRAGAPRAHGTRFRRADGSPLAGRPRPGRLQHHADRPDAPAPRAPAPGRTRGHRASSLRGRSPGRVSVPQRRLRRDVPAGRSEGRRQERPPSQRRVGGRLPPSGWKTSPPPPRRAAPSARATRRNPRASSRASAPPRTPTSGSTTSRATSAASGCPPRSTAPRSTAPAAGRTACFRQDRRGRRRPGHRRRHGAALRRVRTRPAQRFRVHDDQRPRADHPGHVRGGGQAAFRRGRGLPAARHDPGRRAQGSAGAERDDLPAGGVAAVPGRHGGVHHGPHAQVVSHFHQRLPHRRGGRDARAAGGLHALQRLRLRRSCSSVAGWT